MFTDLKKKLRTLLQSGQQVIVAIDGNCTAGKTTLAHLLEQEFSCNVLHMDDFFLRPEQRTATRYAQPGGNVDYERFREEVLLPLQQGREFSYRPFSCKALALAPAVKVTPKQLTIIEGTYSQHPYFGTPYALKIFLHIDAKTQQERICQRPAHLQERFFTHWIPMEQLYFDTFQIAEKADICLKTQ